MAETIVLPAPAVSGGKPLWEVQKERRTIRDYQGEPLDLVVASQLLWAAAGISGDSPGLRTPASAGARHPATTLAVANRVTGLAPGIYRYEPVQHCLHLEAAGDFGPRLVGACAGQAMLEGAALVLAWRVEYAKTTTRYGERGRRYILLDLGHACQNLYLTATALGLGCCAIGSYRDRDVNSLLGADGESTAVLYMATVGRPLS